MLIPNANKILEEFIESKEYKESGWTKMPYIYALMWFSYSFLLFFEKVAFNAVKLDPHSHAHSHGNKHDSQQNLLKHPYEYKDDQNLEEETIRNVISNKGRLASFIHRQSSNSYLK